MDNIIELLGQELENNQSAAVFKQKLIEWQERYNNLLQESYWTNTGTYYSILNYLISKHNKPYDLMDHIVTVIQLGADINNHGSLHLAITLGKDDIAESLLTYRVKVSADVFKSSLARENDESDEEEANDLDIDFEHEESCEIQLPLFLNVNQPDIHGQTALAQVISHKNSALLNLILRHKSLLINQPSIGKMDNKKIAMQPLHQAIITNFSSAIIPLLERGASCTQACGENRWTPLLLAARYKHVNIIQTLLESKDYKELITQKTLDNKLAIDLLCESLEQEKKPDILLRGIAILLCHGSDAPTLIRHQELLIEHQQALTNEIVKYARQQPSHFHHEFIAKFHSQQDAVHHLFFAKPSIFQVIRTMFGSAQKRINLEIESLITEENNNFSEDEQKFAEFNRRYYRAIDNRKIYNWRSGMLVNLDKGHFQSWQDVKDYAHANRTTRTADIVREMENQRPVLHQELESSGNGIGV